MVKSRSFFLSVDPLQNDVLNSTQAAAPEILGPDVPHWEPGTGERNPRSPARGYFSDKSVIKPRDVLHSIPEIGVNSIHGTDIRLGFPICCNKFWYSSKSCTKVCSLI